MKTFELVGTPRSEYGKKAAKTFRKENLVPCNLYGNGENVTFTVTVDDVRKLIYCPDTMAVALTIGETKKMAVVKELQFHPVTEHTKEKCDLRPFFPDDHVKQEPPFVVGCGRVHHQGDFFARDPFAERITRKRDRAAVPLFHKSSPKARRGFVTIIAQARPLVNRFVATGRYII